MTFDPLRPYNDLPALSPQAEVESRAILTACIEARAAVAELNQAGELIPQPSRADGKCTSGSRLWNCDIRVIGNLHWLGGCSGAYLTRPPEDAIG